MTKSFVKFASLFAVVAVFLGLVVTGCSEGDRTPGSPVEDDITLKVKVGFEGETPAAGMDCPADTEFLCLAVMTANGLAEVDGEAAGAFYGDVEEPVEVEVIGQKFVVNPWIDNGDDTVTMVLPLPEEIRDADPAGIVVEAYDKEGFLLGLYTANLDFSTSVVSYDFSDPESFRFIPIDDPDLETKLIVWGSQNNVIEVVAGGEAQEIMLYAAFYYKGTFVGGQGVYGFTLTKADPTNENFEIKDNAIAGKVISAADDNVVNIAWNGKSDTMKVAVVGASGI